MHPFHLLECPRATGESVLWEIRDASAVSNLLLLAIHIHQFTHPWMYD